jgi:hypothetical protein
MIQTKAWEVSVNIDPPDYPEPPECCGDMMDVTDDGVCVCGACGKRIEPQPDIEPVEAVKLEDWKNQCATCGRETDCVYCSTECEPPCAHGNKGECDHCDYLSDLAYDASRESR